MSSMGSRSALERPRRASADGRVEALRQLPERLRAVGALDRAAEVGPHLGGLIAQRLADTEQDLQRKMEFLEDALAEPPAT